MKESSFFQRYKEVILGVFMIALASFYLYHSTLIRTRSTVSVSAKLIPELLGILVICLGIAQVYTGVKYLLEVRRQNQAEGRTPVFFSKAESENVIPVILTFVVIFLYAIFFEPLGFIISSIACMFALMWILTPKAKFQPVKFALISIVVAVVVFFAFRNGLDLSLPSGVLEGVPYL